MPTGAVMAKRRSGVASPGALAAGGELLVDHSLSGRAENAAKLRAYDSVGIPIDDFRHSELSMLATGGFSPLEGFMGLADYEAVLSSLRLANGTMWPLPVVLPVNEPLAAGLTPGQTVGLHYGTSPVGLVHVQEVFQRSLANEAMAIYRTVDPAHPGVARLLAESEWLVAGPTFLFQSALRRHPGIRYPTPQETRREFADRGWRRIVGFQTRNPIHRAHEYVMRCAMEITDGLFLSPVVGATKSDDVPASVRWECYEVLVEKAMPAERIVLGALDLAMRYAGPREAILHAIVRQNYGCTHFIVGRDHAGVGNYYGPVEAQRIFDQLRPEDLRIVPLFFDMSFYCRACDCMATARTCSHDKQHIVSLSGSAVRELLTAGKMPPPELVRPEIGEVLMRAYRGDLQQQ